MLPVFALVNAGVALSGEFIRQAFTSSVTLGVMLGLIVGKAVRLGWAVLPGGVIWRHIMGLSLPTSLASKLKSLNISLCVNSLSSSLNR